MNEGAKGQENDSEGNDKSNDLNDNMKYFEGVVLDEFAVDLNIAWDEFSRRHGRYSETDFKGYRFCDV